MKVTAGQVVTFKPEWQDEGDSGFVFIAVDDSDKGRVTVEVSNSTLRIKPTQVVRLDMIASVAG